MNLSRFKRVVVAALSAALLAACGTPYAAGFTATAYGPWTPATVSLSDTSGSPYVLAKAPRTPLTLVFFGYTHCADTCPAVMSEIASALTRLSTAQQSEISVVFVTSDPARDSAPVLRRWLDRYNQAFAGLTGPLAQVTALAASVHLYVGGTGSLAMHATNVLAMNQHHRVVAMWDQTTSSAQYARDLTAMLQGKFPQ